ncbi:hypothetical protein RUM43_005499 [Polyplax serrata]|uniref:MORN repeat-containing protein 3 n=1 Tax=Polyplax serrata TaxID=468196 RepID=A0AAN8S1I6_POLSC
MPFLHPCGKKEPWYKRKEELSHHNGWRCKIFQPGEGYYKGNWIRSSKSGKGVEVLQSGYQYEGDWDRNKKNGFGVLSKYVPNEKAFHLIYIGDYKNNKKHGQGCMHYDDGSIYEGGFKYDKRHGFGKCWFADGSYYEGCWINDLQDGYGMFVQANGNRYEGEFQNGKKNGLGEFYHLATSQRQIGFWENEICQTSTIEDIKFRQSAKQPTPYPIQISKLNPRVSCSVFLDKVEELINNHHQYWKFSYNNCPKGVPPSRR